MAALYLCRCGLAESLTWLTGAAARCHAIRRRRWFPPALSLLCVLGPMDIAQAQARSSSAAQSGAPASNADARAVEAIYQTGFLVRQISRQDAGLIVSVG